MFCSRLLDANRVCSVKGLPGKLRYYQLTHREAMPRFHSHKRSLRLKGQSLNSHLGILWFCCMTGKKRTRLEHAQLAKLFPDGTPRGPHCLELSKEHTVFRIFVTSEKTNDSNLLARVESYVEAAEKHPKLADWLKVRKYGFVLLVETPERAKTIQEALKRQKLLHRVRFVVESVPTPCTLQRAIHEHRPTP